MSLGIDELTAKARTIELAGRTLRVAPLTIDDLGDLQSWIYAQLPDPIASFRRIAEGLPPSARDGMFRQALEEERVTRIAHRIGTPGAGEMTQTLLGLVEVIFLGARKNHPDLTRDELAALVMAAQADAVDRATAQAFGVEAGGGDAGGDDPKAGGADGGHAPSTSKPSSRTSRAATATRSSRSAG